MKSLKRITWYMRPYKWIIIIGVFTVVLPVAMELVVPRMLRVVIDQGIYAENIEAIVRGSLAMLLAATIGAIATLGQGVCRAQLSQGLAFDLRNALYTHIHSLSFADLDLMQTGQLMTRISSDVDVVRMFTSAGLSLILRALLMIAGSVIMMMLIDWQLSLLMFVFLAVAGIVIWVFMRTAQPHFTIVQQKLSVLNTVVQENLAGMQVVKAFVRERYEIGRFQEDNDAYMVENIRVGRILALVLPILMTLTNVGIVAVIWFGGLAVINGRLTVGELVAFNSYLMIGMAPLLLLGNMMTMASRADASARRVLEVTDTPPRLEVVPSAFIPDTVIGRVVFKNVSFSYDGVENPQEATTLTTQSNNGHRETNVLDNVSFDLSPGQQVALLGATGAGKSSLVNLVPRFYDVAGGRIEIDGVDVRSWNLEALRSRIGTVLQQVTLFSGTIHQNIAYGRPQASLQEVTAAAMLAQAHDFIMAMPNGYDSYVEARGANLSGGQKQRIAIARAILVNPVILILDDSTSAVDLETEVKIQDALDGLTRRITTLIVAQRIMSVVTADQILILDNGRVAARGTHRELLKTSPIYRDIYRSQLGNPDEVAAQ